AGAGRPRALERPPLRRAAQAERREREARLVHRPCATVDPLDGRPAAGGDRPGRPRRAAAAAEVEDPRRGRIVGPEGAHRLTDREVVQRAVEQGEGRALALALEGGPSGEPAAALDVERGEGLEGAPDLREREP